MRTASEAVLAFQTTIVKYPALAEIQKALLDESVTNGNDSLAATRVLSLMGDTDIQSLVYRAAEKVVMVDSNQSNVRDLEALLDRFKPYAATLRVAIGESKKFLPAPTVDVLIEYDTDGAPLERLAVGAFMVLAANLQE